MAQAGPTSITSQLPGTLPAAAILSSRLRIEPVIGDGMAPRLRPGVDFVLVKPVTAFEGDGLYLVGGELMNAQGSVASDRIRLWRENPNYSDETIDKATFDEIVLGIVVADIRTQGERALRGLLNN